MYTLNEVLRFNIPGLRTPQTTSREVSDFYQLPLTNCVTSSDIVMFVYRSIDISHLYAALPATIVRHILTMHIFKGFLLVSLCLLILGGLLCIMIQDNRLVPTPCRHFNLVPHGAKIAQTKIYGTRWHPAKYITTHMVLV